MNNYCNNSFGYRMLNGVPKSWICSVFPLPLRKFAQWVHRQICSFGNGDSTLLFNKKDSVLLIYYMQKRSCRAYSHLWEE